MSSWNGMPSCVICEKTKVMIPGNRTCDNFNCRQEYQRWMQAKKPVCAICGKLLRTHSSASPICDSDVCSMRWIGWSRSGSDISMARCTFCGVYTIRRGKDECLCRDQICVILQTLANRAEQQRIADEKYQRLVVAAEKLRDQSESRELPLATTDYLIALVPHTSAELSPPNHESLQTFRKRLEEMVEVAFGEPEQDSDWPRRPEDMLDPATKSELPIFAQACTACRGKCCHQGGDHAFLSIGIMRRFIRQHPDLNAEQVVNSYVSCLPDQSLLDSCIFHTDKGCNMPREMRADTCNQFICDSLREIRHEIQNDAPGFFIASERNAQFFDSRFVVVPKSDE